MPLRPDKLIASVEVPTMLSADELSQLIGARPQTILRWSQHGDFPKPILDGPGQFRRWLTSDFLEWMQAKKAKRDA